MNDLSNTQKAAIKSAFNEHDDLVRKTKLGDVPNLIHSLLKKAEMSYSRSLFYEAYDYCIHLIVKRVQSYKAKEV